MNRLALVVVLIAATIACSRLSAPRPATEPTPQPKADESLHRQEQIRNNFKLNFGRTLWGSSVKVIVVSGNSIRAQTDIYPDIEGKELGTQICHALRGNYRQLFEPNDLDVRVISNQDTTLARCSTY